MIASKVFQTRITKTVKETEYTVTWLFEKPKDFIYYAGQFATIDSRQFKALEDVNRGRKDGARAYSFASSPTEEHLALTIKEEKDGRFSPFALKNIKERDKIELRAPFGHFIYEGKNNVVLIGAGSGIVPLRSIIKYIIDSKLNVQIKLFFSNKTERDIIYKKELDEWSELKNVKIIHNFTREKEMKRINEEHITKHIENFSDYEYFLCGPNDFCNSMREILVKKGVVLNKIKMEKYN